MNKMPALVVAFLVMALAACGGGSGGPTAPTPIATPTPTPTPVPPPITIGENEVEIARTLLEFGKPGAVFPITREISQAGTIRYLIESDKTGLRIDYYVFFSEADARACAPIIEGGRGQGQLFEPACDLSKGGGWKATVTQQGSLSPVEIPPLTRSYTIWGVFKNTDANNAPYSIWGKTRFEPK